MVVSKLSPDIRRCHICQGSFPRQLLGVYWWDSCRPGINQRIIYNGHKGVHGIQFQSVVTPNGLIANLFGPVEGRKLDSGMLADSGLCTQLQQHARGQNRNIRCLYGDKVYPLRSQLLGLLRVLELHKFNKSGIKPWAKLESMLNGFLEIL